MKTLEHDEQVTLMQWWALAHQQFGVSEQLLFAIPNGGQRNVIVASKLKEEGVRPGVPDLFLATPACGYHGLFIEMKKIKGGRVSEYQKTMIERLKMNGYLVQVCEGWLDAKEVIMYYLRSHYILMKGAINDANH